ncbi:aminotransferase class V-fold PLP-dependent enzyme [Flaviaesturariibacter amylovorans]|uniref:Aminotransferase class V-fold PLP-dependent enzyme n=1 Tax=Flaviaesturariibacter amylovorans TaxID=1084520 RepID=A0ABP8GKF7_9BACT
MPHRRHFLRSAGLAAAGLFGTVFQPAWSRGLQRALRDAEGVAPGDLAAEEEFWYYIQQAFTGTPGLINFNNGGVSPAPRVVAEAMKSNYDFSNGAPSFNMWRILDQGREPLRRSLAAFGGCNPNELALNRNATEGLDTVIFGLPLSAGDEVVLCRQDYNHVVFSWQQRAARDGIRINWVDLQLPSEDEHYLVQQYVNAFTPRTKAVTITHMINWNGQLLPVRAIADEARKRGIAVLVDGAHSFAQLDFRIPDLGADYFATSLHKWTYAPIGTGALWVRPEKIAALWPLHGAEKFSVDDIRKFEHLGTRPFYIEQATHKAVEFNEGIGLKRKQERLYYLKNYWMERVKDLPGVRLSTPFAPKWSGAIGMISFEGKKPNELDSYLYANYKIHCTTIDWNGVRGVRITPNVYTTLKQLDLLVDGIRRYAGKS